MLNGTAGGGSPWWNRQNSTGLTVVVTAGPAVKMAGDGKTDPVAAREVPANRRVGLIAMPWYRITLVPRVG